DADEGFGRIEDIPQDLCRQSFQREQVVQLAVFGELRIGRIEPHDQGSSSCSTRANRPCGSRVNSILCPRGVSSVAPTNCGAIGSCLPPRSTRAASFTFPGLPESNTSFSAAGMVRPV